MTVLNRDKILDAAKDFVAQGKLDKAIREYEKLLQADPKDMRIKLRLAELFAKQRQVSQAIQAYREVADSYAREGFYLKAVTVLKSILRLNPSLLDINQALAELYEKMGLGKDASHQYEILADSYEQKGQHPEALKMREKLVGLFPESPTYRIRLAEAYQREDQAGAAIEQFAILAEQYEKEQRDSEQLIDLYEKILPARMENQEMFTRLVDLYYQKKDYKSALRWLEQRKQLVASNLHLLLLQAEMYAAVNQLDTARGKYQQLAQLYLEGGGIEQALKAYETILVLLPEEAETVKGDVEKIQAGVFPTLLQRALERRAKREKEEALQEQKKEEAREERKKIEVKKVVTPAKPKEAPVGTAPTLEKLLKAARSSLSLCKAYQAAGLVAEANQEKAHAKEALRKVLAAHPDHPEASQLLKELE